MEDKLKYYSIRLADYVRMSIEIGQIKEDSPIGIAYRDFMVELTESHCAKFTHGENNNQRRPLYSNEIFRLD